VCKRFFEIFVFLREQSFSGDDRLVNTVEPELNVVEDVVKEFLGHPVLWF